MYASNIVSRVTGKYIQCHAGQKLLRSCGELQAQIETACNEAYSPLKSSWFPQTSSYHLICNFQVSIHLFLITCINCLLHIAALNRETKALFSYTRLILRSPILGRRQHYILETYPQWLVQKVHQKTGEKPSIKVGSAEICSGIQLTRSLFFFKDCQKNEALFQMPDNCCTRGYNTALCNTFVPSISLRGREKYLLILLIAPATLIPLPAKLPAGRNSWTRECQDQRPSDQIVTILRPR